METAALHGRFRILSYEVTATPKKIVVHVLLHEIRHWAQIATLCRVNGFVGEPQDFLASPVWDGEVKLAANTTTANRDEGRTTRRDERAASAAECGPQKADTTYDLSSPERPCGEEKAVRQMLHRRGRRLQSEGRPMAFSEPTWALRR